MSSLLGMSWVLWQRNRTLLPISIGYVALFGAVMVGFSKTLPLLAQILLFLVLIFALLCLLGMFITQDADVGTAKSAFPSHLFTLPVRTAGLVLWPMIFGTVTMFTTVLFVAGASRLSGESEALWWPPFGAVALLAVLQAIFWYPTGFAYSKLLLTIAAIPAVATAIVLPLSEGISEAAVCGMLAAVTAVSYCIAYNGVKKARRGDLPLATRIARERAPSKPIRPQAPFGSATRAQRWYEWRLHGVILPAVSLCVFAGLCIPLFWNDTLSPVYGLADPVTHRVPTIPTMLLVYYPVLFAVIPFAAWVIGCGVRRTDVKRGHGTLHLFYATRPMSDWDLVRAKIFGAGISTVFAWGAVFAATLPLLLMKSGAIQGEQVFEDGKPILLGLLPYLNATIVLRIVAFLVLLVLLTWRNYMLGFWTELSGRLWLRHGYPVAAGTVTWMFLIYLANTQVGKDGALRSMLSVTWAMWGVILVKMGLAVFLVATQRSMGLLSRSLLLRGLGAYAIAFAVSIGLLMFISEPVREVYATIPGVSPALCVNLFLGIAVLLVPVTRILAAANMLHSTRHSQR